MPDNLETDPNCSHVFDGNDDSGSVIQNVSQLWTSHCILAGVYYASSLFRWRKIILYVRVLPLRHTFTK